jgi:cytochrome c-type biogenesis protein CcmH
VFKSIFALLLVLFACAAIASEAQPVSADPVLEARVQALSEELRCLVCQNQTLADSHAELAIDLKNQVREMLQKGLSDKEVISYMVTRYGDFVLYRPPVKATTWLLWFGPFILFVGALGALFVKIRQRRKIVARVLTPDEHAAAQQLLQNGEGRSSPVSAKGVRA